jgi:O-antigen biosynthesis protein
VPARTPTVSVIVVTRDRLQLLRDALASVAAQTRPPLEIRIADDGDVALDVAAIAAGGIRTEVVRSTARHTAASRNLAARGAQGGVLAFLDDDDRWLADHLAGFEAAFSSGDTQLAYRDVAVVRERIENGARLESARRVIARDWDEALMRTDDFIAPSALAVRREFFESLGGFDESFRFSEDWDFLMRAGRVSRPLRVPGVSVEVRMRDSGHLSGDRGPERRACLARLSERHLLPALEPKTFWEVADVVMSADRT